jgi:hypothetical protein
MIKSISKSVTRGILILFALSFNSSYLSGQDEKSDSLAGYRLNEIEKLVKNDRKNALIWWNGWIWGYNAATLGQGLVYFTTENKSIRQDMALGSVTTLLGALSLIVTPIVPPDLSHQKLQDENTVGDGTKGGQAFYEESLKEIARREKLGRSWKSHALCSAANIGSGLVTWIGFNRTIKDGLINFALNTVVTEAQIWTQPTRAIRDYQNYYNKYFNKTGLSATKNEMEWTVNVYPGRISLILDF